MRVEEGEKTLRISHSIVELSLTSCQRFTDLLVVYDKIVVLCSMGEFQSRGDAQNGLET